MATSKQKLIPAVRSVFEVKPALDVAVGGGLLTLSTEAETTKVLLFL